MSPPTILRRLLALVSLNLLVSAAVLRAQDNDQYKKLPLKPAGAPDNQIEGTDQYKKLPLKPAGAPDNQIGGEGQYQKLPLKPAGAPDNVLNDRDAARQRRLRMQARNTYGQTPNQYHAPPRVRPQYESPDQPLGGSQYGTFDGGEPQPERNLLRRSSSDMDVDTDNSGGRILYARNPYGIAPPERPIYDTVPPERYGQIPPERRIYDKVPPERYGQIPPEKPIYDKVPPERYSAIPPERSPYDVMPEAPARPQFAEFDGAEPDGEQNRLRRVASAPGGLETAGGGGGIPPARNPYGIVPPERSAYDVMPEAPAHLQYAELQSRASQMSVENNYDSLPQEMRAALSLRARNTLPETDDNGAAWDRPPRPKYLGAGNQYDAIPGELQRPANGENGGEGDGEQKRLAQRVIEADQADQANGEAGDARRPRLRRTQRQDLSAAVDRYRATPRPAVLARAAGMRFEPPQFDANGRMVKPPRMAGGNQGAGQGGRPPAYAARPAVAAGAGAAPAAGLPAAGAVARRPQPAQPGGEPVAGAAKVPAVKPVATAGGEPAAEAEGPEKLKPRPRPVADTAGGEPAGEKKNPAKPKPKPGPRPH